ncbi:MAG: hypothetical protein K6357_04065 [Elusimicrobiota bacterium]
MKKAQEKKVFLKIIGVEIKIVNIKQVAKKYKKRSAFLSPYVKIGKKINRFIKIESIDDAAKSEIVCCGNPNFSNDISGGKS